MEDKNLVKENLENLEAIGMLNNIKSDNIIINRANTADNKNYKRVFEIEFDDFVWIEIKDNNYKKEIKEKLEEHFNKKILEIEPNYNLEKNKDIDNQINSLNNKLDSFKFKTKKEIDIEIQRINTEKNRLYGLTAKNAQTRSKARQKIDKFENENNQEESREIIKLSQDISELNNKKSKPISKENKQKINIFEKELKNLQKLKV